MAWSSFYGRTFLNAEEAFENMFDAIMTHGVDTNVGTKAMYNIGFKIESPLDRNIYTRWRNWNPRYAEREWQWYLSRDRSVVEIKKYARTWDKMHGGDNLVNSNYGWQWGRNNQLDKTIEQLRKSPSTRQAWISIFDGKEKDQYTFDTPCTLAVGFDIHPEIQNCLNMTVVMRSCDLVYGFCNDQYCFSKLQELVAKELGLSVGTYFHFSHDLHIYEKHFNMKSRI